MIHTILKRGGVILAIVIMLLSCESELPIRAAYTDYQFASADANGGTWKTVLVASPSSIIIDAPADISSAEYLTELDEMKTAIDNLSGMERENIDYWTNNPALRWNEIALELVAKYNLIPGPNADGTYTLPNPANPGDEPYFPFAHPPYACRMLAYLSVAQFDGLITAWHYKYQFNRPSPAQVDSDVEAAYIDNSIPSYPADGAVIAIASREILSVMFPLEKEYLASKADEHLQSLINSGTNVSSDIEAGVQIGTEVATLALARAATDGMKKAQTPKAVSDSIKAVAFERFGWAWDNLEVPARPVGLTPLFGKVRTWNLPSGEAARPPVPPAPGSSEFNENVRELEDYAENMTEDHRRIANFWQDGLGTYTPPGHWNRIAKELAIEYSLNPLRTARMLAYMNMAIMDGGISCWDAKYYYHYPRPIQTISGFKTIAGTPNFPSYTSGHSVFSAAAAEVLSHIFPNEAGKLRAWAVEAAESRIYGGIHYRFDAEVGTDQGIEVAAYTIAVAEQDGAN